MSSPWRDPRTGIYYIRRGVPAPLRSKLGREYKRSLKTRDPAEAKQLFPVELAKSEKVFAEVRRSLDQQERTEISREEAERIADAWLAMLLEEDEELRMEGLDARSFRKWQETLDINEAGGRYELARGDTSTVEWEVADFIESHGLNIKKGSDAFRQLSYAFLKASVKATELSLRRQQGEAIDTPPVPSPDAIAGRGPAGTQEGDTLSAIYERWKAERQPSPQLRTEWDKVFERFREHHGDLSVEAVTRRHVSEFKDALLRMPARPTKAVRELPMPEILELVGDDPNVPKLQAGSIKKGLAALQAVMAWAVENGYRDDNPATGIKVREAKNKQDGRLPYDAGDLQRIFGSPIFTAGQRPKGGAEEAAYWLPLLALYTGARLEELGQLRAGDIREEGGVAFLDINTEDDGKRLKTRSSKRRVPLHPELVRLGFINYASERRRGDGEKALLFPALKAARNGVLTGNWAKWWGRYQRGQIGITDRRKVFHSFRHTFKDACRAAGIEEAVHDALTGHSGGGVGRSYGQGYTLKVLGEAVDRLSYPEARISDR